MVEFSWLKLGDEAPIAIEMLAAKYDAYASVMAGTTLGMLLANALIMDWRSHDAAAAASCRAFLGGAGVRYLGPAGFYHHALTATGRLFALLYFRCADLLSLRALKKYS